MGDVSGTNWTEPSQSVNQTEVHARSDPEAHNSPLERLRF